MVDKKGGGGGLGRASEQLLAIREAFAGDDVMGEFEQEKAELEAEENAEETTGDMPGQSHDPPQWPLPHGMGRS